MLQSQLRLCILDEGIHWTIKSTSQKPWHRLLFVILGGVPPYREKQYQLLTDAKLC